MSLALNLFYFIVGKHPNNTIFSFNYHNISHINRFLKKTSENIQGNDHVLIDVGAGLSPYYPMFQSKIKKYIAVDVPNSMPSDEKRDIQQIESFAESIPLDSDIATIILSNQVLEHVANPEKTVQEKFRLLKSGGLYIGSVPHISPVHLEPWDYRRFTDLGVKQLLKNAGFTNVIVEGNGGVFRAAALMIMMDLFTSKRIEGKGQKFNFKLAFLFFPIIGMINIHAMILDFIFSNRNRSPSNLCFTAIKP